MQALEVTSNRPSLWKELPFFVKFFSIYFIVITALMLLTIALSQFIELPFSFSGAIYGIVATESSRPVFWSSVVLLLYLYKAVIAILFIKSNPIAIRLAFYDAVIGLFIIIYSMLGFIYMDSFPFGHTKAPEILALVPYLIFTYRRLQNKQLVN